MPIKMIAMRRHYAKGAGKEYDKGESFEVATQREADRLVLRRKAQIHESMRSETPPPRGAAVPDNSAVNDLQAARSAYARAMGRPPHFSWDATKIRAELAKAGTRGGNYLRSDMRAAD